MDYQDDIDEEIYEKSLMLKICTTAFICSTIKRVDIFKMNINTYDFCYVVIM